MRTIIITEQDRQNFIKRVMEFPLGKKKFIAEFKVYRVRRSLRANNLYWMWLNCIHDETGNDVEALHKHFKETLLPWRSEKIFDSEVSMLTSTTSLDSKQFSEYMEKIRIEMLEQGIYLPQPQDQGWDEFYARYGIN